MFFLKLAEFLRSWRKHLGRLLDIQQETDEILRSHRDLEAGPFMKRLIVSGAIKRCAGNTPIRSPSGTV